MSMYVCDTCLTAYKHPWSAAVCCDIISNTVDVDPTPTVALGYD